MNQEADSMVEMILDKLQTAYTLSERDRAYLKFSLTALFYDLSKMIILFFFFAFMGKTSAFLLDITLLILLRSNQGGLHLKHYFSCFLLSFLLLTVCIFFMPILPKPCMLIALTACVIINYRIGPLRNPKCHIENTDFFKTVQRNTFLIVFAYTVILYLCPVSPLLTTGFWIIVFHSIQLVAAKCLQHKKERSVAYEKQQISHNS
jgi:accessory gene regulator B